MLAKFSSEKKQQNLRLLFKDIGCTDTMRRQLTFSYKFPRSSCYSFDRPLKEERLGQSWIRPMVLKPTWYFVGVANAISFPKLWFLSRCRRFFKKSKMQTLRLLASIKLVVTLNGCVCYFFASLFFKSEREHLSN